MTEIFYDRKQRPVELPDNTVVKKRTSIYGLLIKRKHILLVKPEDFVTWELPGGGLKSGESDRDGLTREFFEETGLRATEIGTGVYEEKSNFFADDLNLYFHSTRKVYIINHFKGKIFAQNEIEEVCWFPLEKLFSNVNLKADQAKILKVCFDKVP